MKSCDDAAKGYEVVPSFLRQRTGSRGKNDVRKRASSVEHLQEENDPDHQIRVLEVRGGEGGCRSASSSPVAQRRADGNDGGSPELNLQGFHLCTLPRKKKVPTPNTRHVYATVSKNHGSQDSDSAKKTPPSPLPKPKRGSGGRQAEDSNKEATGHEEDSQADLPRLEVIESEIAAFFASPPALDSTRSSVVSADKPRAEDDTVSLQGIPSSEISHEEAEGGQIYAVINRKTKKGQLKKDGAQVSVQSPPAAGDNGEDVANGEKVSVPKKKPPAKPPRIKPPKPAPYAPRTGSPIPAILAKERGAPLTPLSGEPTSPAPHTLSPDLPPIPDRIPHSIDVSATGPVCAPALPRLPPSPAGKTQNSMYIHVQCICVKRFVVG